MSMLPQTSYHPTQPIKAHESINDLPVHAATMQQIFHPTSESRKFTRVDAAKAFGEKLLPADQRVPHPELTEMERERLAGIPFDERKARAKERNEVALTKKLAADERRRLREEKAIKRVQSGPRWEFHFREVSVDQAGPDGRGPRGTGWRYGVPHMDRRRGEYKIPKRVE
jgi:hypothetical protein